MPTIAPRAGLGDDVVGDQRIAGAGRHRDADADIGLAHDVAGDGDVAQILSEAQHDAGGGRVLDHVSGHRRVRLHRDADAGAVTRVGAGRSFGQEIADDIALHDREPCRPR